MAITTADRDHHRGREEGGRDEKERNKRKKKKKPSSQWSVGVLSMLCTRRIVKRGGKQTTGKKRLE
jgi:hypothetical protein